MADEQLTDCLFLFWVYPTLFIHGTTKSAWDDWLNNDSYEYYVNCGQLRMNCDDHIFILWIIYNYPPKGRWIVVDIYWDAKSRGIYPPLFTDPEGDSCFSIYQIRWIKKCRFINGHNNFFWNFRKTMRHFSLRSQNSEYPRIFGVTGANQNAQILLSTDLVNTNDWYHTQQSKDDF